MAALQVLTGFTTGVTAALTPLTMAAGDNLQIKSTDGIIKLLDVWSQCASPPETIQVRSPRLHDNVQAIQINQGNFLGLPYGLLGSVPQSLIQQDTLIVSSMSGGGAAEIDTTSLLVWYSSLKGSDGNYLRPSDVLAKALNIVTVQLICTPLATGGYSGEVPLNSLTDLLKANTQYALIGYNIDTPCATIGIRGVDTGNIRIGVPGDSRHPDITRNWFFDMSRKYSLPLVPVINSANKANTFIDIAQDDGAAAVEISLNFVELAK